MTSIEKPADGDASWGVEVRAAIGAVNAAHVVFSAEPPPGLSPLPVSNTADAAAIVQSHLDAVEGAGGGIVHLAKPGQSIRFLSGITVPDGVQLRSDELTLLDFSQITSGVCITVADTQNRTPLVGLRMDGSMFTPTTGDLTSTFTGIKVAGRGLVFEKMHLQYFGRAVDIAVDNTFGLTFRDCSIDHAAVGLFADLDGSGATNAGEKIVWTGGSIANCVRGFHMTGNGMHVRFQESSIDFCTEFGKIHNARLYYSGHLERSGGTTATFLFDVSGNARVQIADTEIIMGSGQLFNTGTGPANYGFGLARLSQVSAFFTDPTAASQNTHSELMLSWSADTTTASIYVPWPLKWCTAVAAFCATDTAPQPAVDNGIRVSAISPATGQITLTAAAAHSGQRWVRVKF